MALTWGNELLSLVDGGRSPFNDLTDWD